MYNFKKAITYVIIKMKKQLKSQCGLLKILDKIFLPPSFYQKKKKNLFQNQNILTPSSKFFAIVLTIIDHL